MMGDEDFILFGMLVWYELLQESLQVRFQVLMKRGNSQRLLKKLSEQTGSFRKCGFKF